MGGDKCFHTVNFVPFLCSLGLTNLWFREYSVVCVRYVILIVVVNFRHVLPHAVFTNAGKAKIPHSLVTIAMMQTGGELEAVWTRWVTTRRREKAAVGNHHGYQDSGLKPTSASFAANDGKLEWPMCTGYLVAGQCLSS